MMEYTHDQAVADGVNVPFDMYNIRTKITESGAMVEAGYSVQKQHRETRESVGNNWTKILTIKPKTLSRRLIDSVNPDRHLQQAQQLTGQQQPDEQALR